MSARRATVALVVSVLALALAPSAVLAAEPTFGQPTAATTLGEPLTFTSTVSGDDIAAVEVMIRLEGAEAAVVVAAEPGQQPDTWLATAEIDVATSGLCACLADGQSPPNTHFSYQFRVRAADGSATTGPLAEAIVIDDRFTWQIFEQDLVRVHWYEGDETFGQSAAQVANDAIDKASELLGTTLPEPVDLFVYATEEDMRSAISPNRENVAGQAHSSIDTMFVHIPPGASATEFAGTLVAHELTHLVMNEATANPYSGVPRWMDEGVAVYLSEGYTSYWKSFVDTAVSRQTLIPLDGLRGLFPSSADQFYLAYGESVAAIDFFIRTYGEPTLWDLVGKYAEGVSDDEAFMEATGADVAAFNAAWFASLSVAVPDPVGPQPGAPGPTPSAWPEVPGQATAAPTSSAGQSSVPTASGSTTPGTTTEPGSPGQPSQSPATDPVGSVAIGLIAGLALLLVLALVVIAIQRSRRQPSA